MTVRKTILLLAACACIAALALVAAPYPWSGTRTAGAGRPPVSAEEAGLSVAEARDRVDAVLRVLAAEMQDYRDRSGAWLNLPVYYRNAVTAPDVEVLSWVEEPAAYCVEAAYASVPGTRRRFTSVTNEIDGGTCNAERPLAEQVGDDPAAQSGGRLDVSDVRLRVRPPLPGHPKSGRRFELLFDGKWVGPGEPVAQDCTYELRSRDGTVVRRDGSGLDLTARDERFDDRAGPVFFEDQFDMVPAGAVVECRDRY